MISDTYAYCCKAMILADFEDGECLQENDLMTSDELEKFMKQILDEMYKAKRSGRTLMTAITTTPEVNAVRALEKLGWTRCGEEVHAYPNSRDYEDEVDEANHMLQLWMTPLYDRDYQEEINSVDAFKKAVSIA